MRKPLLSLLFAAMTMTALATPPQGALSGLFSVSATQQVRFSQGNLQYQASTQTWKFAANQLEFIGSAQNGKISPTYDGWIDLFGWGTGDDPTKSSGSATDYTEWVDWGNNAISNGDNHANLWRTLSADEWAYLFNRGDTSLWGLATIGSVTGLILLPDNWENVKPAGITFNPSAKLMPWNGSESFVGTDGYTHNVLDAEQWETLENAGAVFLPTALGRGGDVISFWGWGAYWTSTYSYNICFSATSVCTQGPSSPHYGYSVRLAINKEPQTNDIIEVDGVKYRVCLDETQVDVFVQQDYASATLVIPDSIEYAGRKYEVVEILSDAFKNNTTLTSADIAAKIVGRCAFQGCSNLSELTLREGVETFYTGVFYGIGATSVTLPASLIHIDEDRYFSPFAHNKLTQIVVAEGNPLLVVGEDGALYNKEKTCLYAFPYNYPQKFKEIPSTVKTICEVAFTGCDNVSDTIVVPESLEMADGAFIDASVKCVILNSAHTTLNNMFQATTSVEEVIIGKNVTQVGGLMFRGCNALRKITVYPETMPNWEYGSNTSWPSFSDEGGVFDECKVYIHCGQNATYAADANKWANFTNLIDTLLYDVEPLAGVNGSATIVETTDCNSVKLLATPDEHYEFDRWSNGLTTAEITLNVISDTAVTATFKKAKYKIGFYKDADDAAAAVASTKLAGTTQPYQTDVTSVAEGAQAAITRPECSRFLGWTEDGNNIFDLTSLSKTANVYPLWDMNATFTVVFMDRANGQVIGEPQTDIDCHDMAIAPQAEQGYHWEWESDAWRNVGDDIVIYGTKVQNTTTGIEGVQNTEYRVQKVIRDGELYIMYNGQMYNVLGVRQGGPLR